MPPVLDETAVHHPHLLLQKIVVDSGMSDELVRKFLMSPKMFS